MDPNDVTAGTSPATETTAPSFENLTPDAHKKFMETGDLDLETAFAPPAEKSADAAPGQDDGKTGAAAEAAKETKQELPKPQNREERRNQKLANDLRDARAEIERLKSAPPTTKTEERKAAADGDPRPDPDTFNSIKEWQAADTEWIDRRMEARLAKERESKQNEQTEAQRKTETDKSAGEFSRRAKDHRKTLKEDTFAEDFTEVNSFISKTGTFHLADALVDSEVGPQLITYFGEHFEELEKLAGMSVNGALREFGRLERSDKIKTPAPKKHTSATKLTPEVDGTGSADDEEAQLLKAAEDNDMATFDKIMARQEKRELAESRR